MPADLEKINRLTGQIPINNIENPENMLEILYGNDIIVMFTNKSTTISHGTHHHDSYEFDITYSKIPSIIIDNKIYNRTINTLFAVNPMQKHGLAEDIKGFSLCGIHIDKYLLQSAANSIYGSPDIVFSNDSFTVSHDISMLVTMLIEELRFKQSGYEFMLENLSLLIIYSLMRYVCHNLSANPQKPPNNDKESIKKVLDYMNENYTAGISCTELSKLMKMDKYSFIRNFKAHTSKTPYDYLLDLKIEKAKKMLEMNKYSITDISMMCGFSSHSHFTSTFKKKTGLSPTKYKEGL